MSEHRAFLLEALRDVIAGGDIGFTRLDSAIADPGKLKGAEWKAYYGLSYWADDADIREWDPTYGPMRREGLSRLLCKLEAETSL